MNRNGHLSTGAASGAVVGVLAASAPVAALVCTGIGGVAALLPDIDHHGSTITRRLGPLGSALSWTTRKISGGVYTATKTSTDTPEAGGEHRGLTHTGMAALLAGGLLWLLLTRIAAGEEVLPYALALTIGILTHIAGDALTATGVPLLWPIKIRGERWYACRMPLITITGGGPTEKFLTGLAWSATAALLTLSVADLSHTDLLA